MPGDQLIAIPSGCTLTPTGLVFDRDLSREEWNQVGFALAAVDHYALMWAVGDWLLYGEGPGYLPRGKLAEACERFGIAYQTALNAVMVCRKIESSCRQEHLTFNHHLSVANDPEAPALLEWAVENKATVKELREEKRRRQVGRGPRAKNATGKHGDATYTFQVGDCEHLDFPDDSFDLVFCSPPYESQRAYDELAFCKSGEDWVEWAVACYLECLRVCRGLVAWVVEGQTDDFGYSSVPFLLLADLHRRGVRNVNGDGTDVRMRKPCVYQRNSIPGTGGPDWLRNDWEPIICATKNGKLPWSDVTAMGKPPKQNKPRTATNRTKDGTRKNTTYNDPDVCNPGNIIGGLVGCGGLGWPDAHENEAPFPEWIAEFFIRSFCPPGGTVLDPFSGSGTTVSMAVRNGRNGIGVDARESQIWLGETRLMDLTVAQRKNGQGTLI